ncbi:Metallophos-domain-containing protein [Auriscalpium vulgare]|uniref:Metallophos-domain-containing protein n=1 Tax=Auriscalpium vulgare TaxID=40419 RepID=A0ACB8RU44_9AGAM|nr:Metallophos-domain-containing protein [Auriscalpium vulgare]
MKIAVEGCCHGELDSTYRRIAELESQNNYKVDLLLICGDFQAIRNYQDLQCMAVPPKYRKLGEFHRYYTGAATAPILTIVIGGNHEASNYLWELYHGGWMAPNIYFLGQAGCVQVNGIRIAGASGIFKGHDFSRGHFETLPYDNGSMRSIYHIREFNVRRLSLISSPDIFMSHDWPQHIAHHGNLGGLLRRKPFFKQDIQTGQLGSPPLKDLLFNLKPAWWFAAHLHVRFEATVVHESPDQPMGDGAAAPAPAPVARNPDEIAIDDDDDEDGAAAGEDSKAPVVEAVVEATPTEAQHSNPDEITLDDEEEDVAPPPPPPPPPPPRRETKFLALDKCLPNRQFLEVVDLPTSASFADAPAPVLAFDPEWLAITRAFHPFLSTTRYQPPFPSLEEAWESIGKELAWVKENVGKKLGIEESVESPVWRVDACQKFVMTAPGPEQDGQAQQQQPPFFSNPQTEAIASLLEIPNKIR